ncbi:hypothetical protein BLA60_08090 [Actinophytocola xinjiangensis]|uniref:Uncharacterized protein n=1 Tax=Actinophytocola xinjiangensis TaxID=485602 RepID=A0A7Z0WNS1_9PSEU|nr:hypothetical protein [Actinophytocola xinjiangensis]OLF11985.1 hypothetical protein BLA60_08090 [Actinophytocola xinjiangensis]
MPEQVRRALLLAGLAATVWSTVRVALLLTGNESLVLADDTHGYQAVLSLLLIPFLLVAAIALTTEWRDPAGPWRVTPGVALLLSAPLSGQIALATAALGVTIATTPLLRRR